MELSEAEREQAVRDLTRHCGDGRLTLDELEERVAEVYAATTTAEIEHAMRFLPAPVASQPLPSPAAAPMRPRPPSAPARGGAGEVALRVHLVVYLSVLAFLVAIWFLTSPFGYFWPVWPALGWGLALAIHAGVEKAKGGC